MEVNDKMTKSHAITRQLQKTKKKQQQEREHRCAFIAPLLRRSRKKSLEKKKFEENEYRINNSRLSKPPSKLKAWINISICLLFSLQ